MSNHQQLLGSSSLLADTLKFIPPPDTRDQEIKVPLSCPSSQEARRSSKEGQGFPAGRETLHPIDPRVLPAAALKEGNLLEIHSNRYT